MTAIEPKPKSLAKYGLSLAEWRQMLEDQGGTCAVCDKLPPSRKLHVDHEHAPKWRKKPPEQRRRYVRGLLCNFCNRSLLRRFLTLPKARRVVAYLEQYAGGRAMDEHTAQAQRQGTWR